ncbi:hypothetical protein NE865_08405 [Phthorimaea operculella]|nr:hypothetical protein NE865_08405 [Phthorimaea operculella]
MPDAVTLVTSVTAVTSVTGNCGDIGEMETNKPAPKDDELLSLQHIIGLAEDIVDLITSKKSVTAEMRNGCIERAKEIAEFARDLLIQTGSKILINDAIDRIETTFKQEISKFSVFTQPQPAQITSKDPNHTYSSILKNTPPGKPKKVKIPSTKPAIIISPTEEVSSSAETHKLVKKNITFKDTNFAPANIRYVSNNKISMEFDKPEQMEKTLKKIHESNCPIKAEKSKKLKPMFVLKGIPTEIPPEELTELISRQNETIKNVITSQEDLVFKFKRNNRKEDLYNAVFMTTPTIYRAAVTAGRVNVDHQRIYVEEYTPLLQCYKCLQFGHTRLRCTNEDTICSHCAAMTHNFKDCPVKSDNSKINCYNCDKHLKRHNSSLAVPNHTATSKNCPRVIQMTENLRTRIDYGQ